MRRPRSSPLSLIAVLALVLPACGGSTAPSAAGVDGGTDAQTDSAAAGADALVDSPIDAPAYLACMDASGQVDASLKVCQSDSDCVIEQEQADCCGTVLYVGIASTSVSRFGACEPSWVAHFPACGCDSGQTRTEDGHVTYPGMDAGAPQVGCVKVTDGGSRVCMTSTP